MFDKKTKNATTATEPADHSGLPAEHLDPASRLFIPERLRPFYDHSDQLGQMLALRSDPHAPRHLARRIERERLAADPEAWQAVLEREANRLPHDWTDRARREAVSRLTPQTWQPDLQTGDRLEKALTTDDLAYGAHLRELDRAEQAYQRAKRNAATRTKVTWSRTCDVCCRVDDSTRQLGVGHLGLRVVSQSGSLKACERCARALGAALAEAAATETVDGRTRHELAAAWIEAHA